MQQHTLKIMQSRLLDEIPVTQISIYFSSRDFQHILTFHIVLFLETMLSFWKL